MNKKFHHNVHKTRHLTYSILRLLKPVHNFISCLSLLILSYHLGLHVTRMVFVFEDSDQNYIYISHFPVHATWPSHLILVALPWQCHAKRKRYLRLQSRATCSDTPNGPWASTVIVRLRGKDYIVEPQTVQGSGTTRHEFMAYPSKQSLSICVRCGRARQSSIFWHCKMSQ